MGNIVVLDELTINKIAAGEVVERPASVIKEMVENSIDAGATQITVEIRRGGITYIRVTDNGSGIEYDDVLLAFEKHATSKIICGDDLDAIKTLGFRGEALSSISAVSKVDLTTKVKSENHGVKVSIHGGTLIENTTCGCPDGTSFIVRELFYNTPARYKFLKKDATEAGHVIDLIERAALSHPEISFRLINNGSETIRTRGDGILKNVIYSIYGKEVTESSKEMNFEEKGVKITGFTGGINTASSSRGRQSLFINGRYVRSKVVYSAIDEAYKTLMMKGKYPFIIINISISPQHVDVNVHPTKMEIRFSDDGAIYRWVHAAICTALFRKADSGDGFICQDFKSADTYTANLYANPFEIKTKAEVRESREEYKVAVQELPVNEGTVEVKTTYIPESRTKVKETQLKPGIQTEDQAAAVQLRSREQTKAVQPQSREQATEEQPQSREQLQAEICIKESFSEEISEEREILKNALYVGQAFNTYIILQYREKVIFLDQHAAHERVLYEKIKKQYREAEVSVQPLLTPVILELTKSEFIIYENNKEFFAKLGLGIDEFGENSVMIREIPVFMDISVTKQVVMDIIRDIMDSKINIAGDRTAVSDDTINLMACKAAIKANHRLDEREVRALLDEMLPLENPFTCPHGRPTTICMTKSELERKFKRVL